METYLPLSPIRTCVCVRVRESAGERERERGRLSVFECMCVCARARACVCVLMCARYHRTALQIMCKQIPSKKVPSRIGSLQK